MAFKKLTYSGSECNNYFYFAFDGDYFDTTIISETLKLKPTTVRIKKEPVPKFTSWKYKFDCGSDLNLETYMEKLIEIFEKKVDEINWLKKNLQLTTRLKFVININVRPDASTPYFGLNKRIIDFLYQTGTSVDYDLYKCNSIGLSNN